MPRIRWEEDFEEFAPEHAWLGYLGAVIICRINWKNTLFSLLGEELIEYSKLSSAKRGAERMLQRFMDEAGLEVKSGY